MDFLLRPLILTSSWNRPTLYRAPRGRLKEMFQSISEVVERPTALLKENPGASHGQKSRSTGQPKRDEATRSGTEKRRAVEVLALSLFLPHRRVPSFMQKNDDMPEKATCRGS